MDNKQIKTISLVLLVLVIVLSVATTFKVINSDISIEDKAISSESEGGKAVTTGRVTIDITNRQTKGTVDINIIPKEG